jgi:hypothetical protein
VENTVDQLNDMSTQPAATTTSPSSITGLEAKISAVEKQLHAALGAKIKLDASGKTEPCRIPTMHQLNNYVESTRKRLKLVEDMDGLSKCSQFLQQLQVNNVANKNVVQNTRAAPTCIMDSEDEDIVEGATAIPENDELETEEAILNRQVELTTPAKAKEAAEQIIKAKKQVTFLEKPASPQE